MPNIQEELSEIKKEVRSLRKEIRSYIERSNEEMRRSAGESVRSGLYAKFSNYARQDMEDGIDSIAGDCPRRDECLRIFRGKFSDVLEEGRGEDTNVLIQSKYRELEDMLETMPQKCEACFELVFDLLDKQCDIIRTLSRTKKEKATILVSELDPGEVVSTVLDPVSNHLRLRILQALYNESRTFSYLSETTGLEGGNLLFHINKLRDASLITQKQERGEYTITELGRQLLGSLAETYQQLQLYEHEEIIDGQQETVEGDSPE